MSKSEQKFGHDSKEIEALFPTAKELADEVSYGVFDKVEKFNNDDELYLAAIKNLMLPKLTEFFATHYKAREAEHEQHKGEPHYFHTAEDQSSTGSAGVRLICKCGATKIDYDQETHDFLARSLTVDNKMYQKCPNCGTPVLLSKESKS